MRRRSAGIVVALVVAGLAIATARARQVQPKADNNITPVYEGWVPNPDGSFELLFGY